MIFFLNNTSTTEIYTLSLHDALPIWRCAGRDGDRLPARQDPGRVDALRAPQARRVAADRRRQHLPRPAPRRGPAEAGGAGPRSEEHTSELQSRQYLVCRLLLEQKNKL